VVFRPDGKAIASASTDGTVKLWLVETAKELATLAGHVGPVNVVAFSPDGRALVSGGADQTVRGWDAHTGAALFTLDGHAGAVSALAFSPDGKALVSGGEDGLKLWDLTTRKEQHAFQGYAGVVSAVALSPDGTTLASGGTERDNQGEWFGEVKLWDTATYHERATLRGQIGLVRSLAFAAGGQTLAVGGGDATVRLWDVVTGQELAALHGHAGRVSGVAFRADGSALAVAGGSQDGEGQWGAEVSLWKMEPGRERVVRGHFGPVLSAAFAPDGKTLATVGAVGHDRFGVKVWDPLTGRNRHTLLLPDGKAHVAFTPDGKSLVTAGETVALWDAATGKRRWALPGHQTTALPPVFTDGGRTLVTASDGEVKVWDVNAGKELRCFPFQEVGPPDAGRDVNRKFALAPDGRSLAWAAWGEFSVRNLAEGRNRFDPVWLQSKFGTPDDVPDDVSVMIFSPDGRSLVVGNRFGVLDGSVELWSPTTGKNTVRLQVPGMAVESLAFSPDGSTLASGCENGAIHLWTPPLRQKLLTPHGNAAGVTCLAFTTDGKTLASGGHDGSLRLWNVTSAPWRSLPIQRLGGSPVEGRRPPGKKDLSGEAMPRPRPD
jgi:WD40 repeat protein